MSAKIRINEIFFSIQGESLLAGKPAVFIRVAVGHLRVSTESRTRAWQGKLLSVDEIIDQVKKHETRYVCVTGGEPLGQKATIGLLEALATAGYFVSLETTGEFSIREVPLGVHKVLEILCGGENVAWENLSLIRSHDQVKFAVGSKDDFSWALKVCEDHQLFEKCQVLFSPVYGTIKPLDLAQWILQANVPLGRDTDDQTAQGAWPSGSV